MLEILTTSTLAVALAEIGDKTQLLAIVLATRFKRPVPIILGILGATILNHALAALVGASVAHWLAGSWFQILVAVSFIVMGLWTLIPDKLDDEAKPATRYGAFLTTLVAFFLVEMGDKTQIATIALGAKFQNVAAVTAGTTLGMMIANVPAVLFGDRICKLVPLDIVRTCAAGLFMLMGALMLVNIF